MERAGTVLTDRRTAVSYTHLDVYKRQEYACACGMSLLTTDTKGDLYRNYAGIAKKYYGYHTAVIDLRNPTRSDGDNMLLSLIHIYGISFYHEFQ